MHSPWHTNCVQNVVKELKKGEGALAEARASVARSVTRLSRSIARLRLTHPVTDAVHMSAPGGAS